MLNRFKKLVSAIDMTVGRPWEKLLLFTAPLLIGNLFQQLYSTADAIFLGRFVGDYALAAVGSSMTIFFLITVLMMGIAMGSGIMVSQYLGAKKREELSYTVGVSITIITIVCVFVMIIGPFLTRPLLILLRTPAEIVDDGVLYMNVLLWGILGLAYFNILSGILRGLGDSFSPLIFLIIASLFNIALNFMFIVILGWGVLGAAMGTVVAQGLTSILCFRQLMKMSDVFDMGWKYFVPKRLYVIQILKLGVPSGVSQAIFAVAMMIVQPLVNSFGAMFIAANVVVIRIDSFVMMPNFSFGNSITVYTGQNVGAGKMDRVVQGMKQCSFMAGGTSIIIVAMLLLFGHHIAGLFTQNQEVVDLSMRMIRILAIGYVAFSVNMVLWGVIRGAGDAMSPLVGSILNSVIIRVPTAFIFVHLMRRPEALMYSLLAGWIFNLIIAIVVYRMGRWKTKSITNKAPEVNEGVPADEPV